MTNPERHKRIAAIYDHAAREGREINDDELEELERLSEEIYAEANAWLNKSLPVAQSA